MQAHEKIYSDIKNKNAKISKINSEKQLAKKVLGKRDEFAGLIIKTPSLVPSGIEINRIEYKKEDYAVFEGNALSNIDLNIFLEKLKKNIGKSELTTMNETEIVISQEGTESEEEEIEQEGDQSASYSIKAKNFSIKIDLSGT
tara:strand:- start:159 stop:587 length:429 start_codon:yes stop_codon:yes gene_type:complete